MEPKPADFIKGAHVDERTGDLIVIDSHFTDRVLDARQISDEMCHWIAAAINEKIQREKAVPSPQEAVTVTDEYIHQFLRDERIIRVENHDACFDLIKKFVRSRIGKTE